MTNSLVSPIGVTIPYQLIAAMSSSLSKIRSVAISYATLFEPTPEAYFDSAHNQGCHIINHLWNNWGEDECGLRDRDVDLYPVNIPLIEQILGVDGLKVCWTRLFRNSYGQLFKNVSGSISPSYSRSWFGSSRWQNRLRIQRNQPLGVCCLSGLRCWKGISRHVWILSLSVLIPGLSIMDWSVPLRWGRALVNLPAMKSLMKRIYFGKWDLKRIL